MNQEYETCEHDWKEVDSQSNSEVVEDVRCVKCGCAGERDTSTGGVVWPTT